MSTEPIVRVRGLSKRFPAPAGRSVPAVGGVDLELHPGEVVLVTGPSGSGKTTLLSLIAGIQSPTEGSIRVCGEDVVALSGAALQAFRLRSLGFVFQSARLIDALSAAENVELPLDMAGVRRPDSRERAHAILERMGLGGRTDFGTEALSGGERQRVSIARALVMSPPVLLADEPTAMLDSVAAEGVLDALVEAAGNGTAVLIVSHDLELSEAADRTLLMRDGRIRPPEASEGS